MNKLLPLGVAVALILGAVGTFKTKTVTVDKNISPEELGAVFTYMPTPSINLGGLRLVGTRKDLATATTTVCAIQSPSATSTLVTAGVDFKLASTSAVIVDFSNSTTQYATSTRINGTAYYVGASLRATIVASSTGSVSGDATIFAPSTWFVAKYSGQGNGAGSASTGSCWATWAVTAY